MITYNQDEQVLEIQILGYKIQSVYQEIKTEEGVIHGYEALCRATKNGEGVSPKKLFNFLEKLDDDLEFKVKFAINVMHIRGFIESEIYNEETKLFLNFSPCFFRALSKQDSLINDCVKHILTTGIKLEQIVVEIVEDYCPIDEITNFYDGINKIRSQGVSLAVDDFGTGWSGFSRVAAISPDYIKVSRELLVASQVGLTEELEELKVICGLKNTMLIYEGIECIEQLELAKAYGSNLYQGYYLSFPRKHPFQRTVNHKAKIEKTIKTNAFTSIHLKC
ncbi:EAL domain-containing protein [Vibrio fortis]|uniref:EAL domain-containing protein n=1 Tax=Vibrio TaxID=662 RepID=UPI0012684FA4|nr:EAL domain-containing protein [Vibrio sp. THAF190c]QFT11328.1 Oxygen sensor protein DosP [Vibrio sp. THAF190c]